MAAVTMAGLGKVYGNGYRAMVVARFDGRTAARIGDRVEVGVAVDELHFFDPTTGLRIAGTPAVAPALGTDRVTGGRDPFPNSGGGVEVVGGAASSG